MPATATPTAYALALAVERAELRGAERARAWIDDDGLHVVEWCHRGRPTQYLVAIVDGRLEELEEEVTRCPGGDHELGEAVELRDDRFSHAFGTSGDVYLDGCETCIEHVREVA